MSDELIQDPNAPTHTQAQLKRVDVASRRQCDCELLLFFDGIALLGSPAEIATAMQDFKQRLDHKIMKG